MSSTARVPAIAMATSSKVMAMTVFFLKVEA